MKISKIIQKTSNSIEWKREWKSEKLKNKAKILFIHTAVIQDRCTFFIKYYFKHIKYLLNTHLTSSQTHTHPCKHTCMFIFIFTLALKLIFVHLLRIKLLKFTGSKLWKFVVWGKICLNLSGNFLISFFLFDFL